LQIPEQNEYDFLFDEVDDVNKKIDKVTKEIKEERKI